MRLVTRREQCHRLAYYVCVALTYACVASCADERESPGPHELLDSPSLDASFLDARIDDGSAPDGAVDAAHEDSSNACRVLSVDVVAERSFDPRSALSVAVREQAALLSWSQYSAGKSRVISRWLSVGGEAVEAPNDGDSSQADVHSTSTTTGFFTTWSDEGSKLHARRTDADGVPLDVTPVTLTDHGASDSVSAQGADGKLLVAFRSAAPLQGRTLLLGSDAKPLAPARDIPGFGALAGRPALAAFRSGFLLAWVDASERRVHLQALDATGAPSGAAKVIDSDGDAQGGIDLAATASGGAVAWDVLLSGSRAEVRVRTFGADATPTGAEQKATAFPDTGLRPSLVAARGGYLLAYRSAQADTNALLLRMLDSRAIPLSTRALTVAGLQQQDLPLAMRMSNDGQTLFVGWLDLTPNSTDHQLQRAWIGCD